MADGATLKRALKQMRENQLFWTREVYERIMLQQLRIPTNPKGKGKGKDQDWQRCLPGPPEALPQWLQGWRLPPEAFLLGQLQQISCLLSGSTVGPAMGTTPLTSAQTRVSLEPSRDLGLTAHRDRRAVRRILRMKSQQRLRQTGSRDWRRLLCLQKSNIFPTQYQITRNWGRRQR